MDLGHLLKIFNEFFTFYLVFPSIVLLGIFLTWRLRCVQISKLKLSVTTLFSKGEPGEGSVSHFQALSSVLASNIGTGNISGIAIALAMGGPGALVWMWVMAFLGSAIQFASCFLGVKYRKKGSRGEYAGGPMYYLSEGLGWKKMAAAFSVMVIVAAFAVGNFAQVNSVILPFEPLGVPPFVSGIIMAILVAIVVLGGAGRVTQVSTAVVPVMAIIYLGAAAFILGTHVEQIPAAFKLMLQSACGIASVAGGTLGFAVMKAVTTGFDRAIFATDAGTGTVPILQAEAKTKHPVHVGVVTIVAPFLVMIVCTCTALVLIVTGAWKVEGLKSTNMVTYAFNSVLGTTWGTTIILISLFLFGYTTTIAWATCLERALGYLSDNKKWVKCFQWLYILLVPVGACLKVDFVWILADIALTAMLILNLAGVAGLSKEVIRETRAYFSPAKRSLELE